MAEAPSYSDAVRVNLPAARASPVAGPAAGPSANAPAATSAAERERMLRAYIAELERAAEVRTGKIPPAPAGVTDRSADALRSVC